MTQKSLTDTFTLPNGVKVPCIGFGTWQIPDEASTVTIVCNALKYGYRHIDTAAAYENEASIGKAVKQSMLPRNELFVTSKLWNTDRGYDKTIAAFEKSLAELQLDYLDLYLIHWTANEKQFKNWQEINADTWRAFETLYKKKRIRAIGISNFLVHHLEALLKTAEIVPMVNQIEFHPGYMQQETLDYCRQKGLLVEAWSPLGQGKILTNSDLKEIAKRYNKTTAQVCVRWCLQHGTLPLPKSATDARIKENADVFDFELSASDMKTIDSMAYVGGSGLHPDKVNF